MTGRIAHVLARCSGTTPCTRCPAIVTVTAGRWHTAETNASHLAVCDHCAQHDDPAGYGALLAWRRASARPATGTRNRS